MMEEKREQPHLSVEMSYSDDKDTNIDPVIPRPHNQSTVRVNGLHFRHNLVIRKDVCAE